MPTLTGYIQGSTSVARTGPSSRKSAAVWSALRRLSDERCEYLVKDRLSFMRFLGLVLADPVPDANTIWAFREALKSAGAVERLFAQFDATLRAPGYPNPTQAGFWYTRQK